MLLINRTTRRLSRTEAGKTMHSHCLALLDEAQAAKVAMIYFFFQAEDGIRDVADWSSDVCSSDLPDRHRGRLLRLLRRVGGGARRRRKRWDGARRPVVPRGPGAPDLSPHAHRPPPPVRGRRRGRRPMIKLYDADSDA